MSDQRNNFEQKLKNSFNFKLGEEGTSFRRREHKGAPQRWDLAVVKRVILKDYEIPLVAVIEAKSRKVVEDPSPAQKDIYFKQFFQNEDGPEQALKKFKNFSDLTGFKPYFAVENRLSTGSYAYILTYDQVYEIWESGEPKIPMDEERLPDDVIELERYPTKKRQDGHPKYKIPDAFFESLKRQVRLP